MLFLVSHPLYGAHTGTPTDFGSRTVGHILSWLSQQDFLHIQGYKIVMIHGK